MLCQAENKSFFDEPLRHEGTKGYGVFNPRISRISQIFANFRWGDLNREGAKNAKNFFCHGWPQIDADSDV
jgi:hypothetical protein